MSLPTAASELRSFYDPGHQGPSTNPSGWGIRILRYSGPDSSPSAETSPDGEEAKLGLGPQSPSLTSAGHPSWRPGPRLTGGVPRIHRGGQTSQLGCWREELSQGPREGCTGWRPFPFPPAIESRARLCSPTGGQSAAVGLMIRQGRSWEFSLGDGVSWAGSGTLIASWIVCV